MEVLVKGLEGEEREGFYVPALMKKAWGAQLRVLKEIDAICKRHDIKYFAQWGTLLGAVRHQGFIPWDDDLDIAMLRGDYERFKYYARIELPQDWVILDINNDDFHELLTRVTNGTDITMEREFLMEFYGCPYVMGVDIFCMDYIPRKKEEEELLLNLLGVTYELGTCWEEYVKNPKGLEKMLVEVETCTGYHFDRNKAIKNQLKYLADKISAMYWDSDADEVTFMHLLKRRPHHRIPVSIFENIIEVPFENTTIPIPECYDLLLKCDYGENYMTPVMRKSSHAYPFFKEQILELREYYQKRGEKIPEIFDMRLDED